MEGLLKLAESLWLKEIHSVKDTGVFCVDKAGFLRLSHIHTLE